MHETASVPTSNTTPLIWNFFQDSIAEVTMPRKHSKDPGIKNNHRGENSSMNRKFRHPSRHGFKCGGRERLSLYSVIGTSANLSCLSAALMTISEANSMPVVCKSILSNPVRVKPRRPQLKSRAWHLK